MASASSQAVAERSAAEVKRWLMVFSIVLGTLMGAIDMSIINVALPEIRASLGVTLTQVSWVATGYLVAVVVILPLTPWLAAVVGRKNLYLMAVVLFVTASFFCGLSHSLQLLLCFRAIQGLAAGLMQPVAQAVLRESFPPAQQAMAMGIFGIAILLGPAIGPTLGGWLTDNYGWPWVFFINIPVGIVTLLMASRFLFDPDYLKRQSISEVDYPGVVSLTIGLAALQTVLSEGQSRSWFESLFISSLAGIAGVALVAFVLWELQAAKPAVDLPLLANATYTSGTLLGSLLGLALFGGIFLLPLFMQELLGYDALQSGIAMLPRSVVMMVGMPLAGRLYNHLGPRLMVATGLSLSVVSVFQMGRFTADTSYIGLLIPQAWQGIAFSFIFVSLSTAALATIPRPRMTNATALYNLARQLGGSFGIAIIATLLENKTSAAAAVFGKNFNLYNPAFTQRYNAIVGGLESQGIFPTEADRKALALMSGMVQRQSAVIAFEYVFNLIGVFFIATLPLVLFLRPRKEAIPTEAL